MSFPSVDPFELSLYSLEKPEDNSRKRALESSVENGQEDKLNEDTSLQALKRPKRWNGKSGPELARMFTEHLRHNAAWMVELNYTPAIFQALGSLQIWPFTALGNVLENAMVLSTRANDVSIDVGISGSDGQLFIAVTDNGRGMNFTTFNKALKRFGHCDGPMERRDTMRSESFMCGCMYVCEFV